MRELKGGLVLLPAPEGLTYDGDQLELFEAKVLRVEPWSGQSPRVLTKAYQAYSLGAHPLRGLRG